MPCSMEGCACEDAPLRQDGRAFCSPDCLEHSRSGKRLSSCGCRHPECPAAHPSKFPSVSRDRRSGSR